MYQRLQPFSNARASAILFGPVAGSGDNATAVGIYSAIVTALYRRERTDEGAWAAIHLQFLATSSLRLSVFLEWVWTYLTGQRGSRLIIARHESESVPVPTNAGARAAISSK